MMVNDQEPLESSEHSTIRRGELIKDSLAMVVLLVLVTAFALFVSLPIHSMIFRGENDTRLLGTDAYYHLRHARYVAENFPNLLRYDPEAHFSHVIRSDACGLFDIGIALGALFVGGGTYDEQNVFLMAAWSPVLLAALSCIALYVTSRQFAGRALSLLTVVMFLLYPGPALMRMMLGFADHHAAEILLALLSFLGLYRCLKIQQHSKDSKNLYPDFVNTIPLILFQFTWVGAPIYIGIIGLTTILLTLFAISRAAPTWPICIASIRFCSAVFIGTLAIGGVFPSLVMHPNTFGYSLIAAGLFAIGPAVLSSVAKLFTNNGLSPRWTVRLLALGAVIFVLVAAQISPDVRAILTVLERKSLTVSEQIQASNIAKWYLTAFGFPGLLSVAALPLIIQRLWKEQSTDGMALLGLATACSLIWLMSRWVGDYDYITAAVIPILATITIVELSPGFRQPKRLRRIATAAVVTLVIAPVWPLRMSLGPFYAPNDIVKVQIDHDGWRQTTAWLQQHSPEFQNERKPDYGIACAWEFGNIVSVRTNRVPVWSRYPNKRLSQWIFASSISEADSKLNEICGTAEGVKYVILDERTITTHLPGHTTIAEVDPYTYLPQVDLEGEASNISGSPAFEKTVGNRLYHQDGKDIGVYRLVFESPDLSAHVHALKGKRVTLAAFRGTPFVKMIGQIPEDKTIPTILGLTQNIGVRSSVKTYERVQGARISGHGPPDTPLQIALPLRAKATSRSFTYLMHSQTDADGKFEVRVPYATEAMPNCDIESVGSYSFTFGSDLKNEDESIPEKVGAGGQNATRSISFDVAEKDVVQGELIDLGDLNSASGATIDLEVSPMEP